MTQKTLMIKIEDSKHLAFKVKATMDKTNMTNILLEAIDIYLDENKK